jgi:hypothetical protein
MYNFTYSSGTNRSVVLSKDGGWTICPKLMNVRSEIKGSKKFYGAKKENHVGMGNTIYVVHMSLRPESSENISILFQGADLYFSNQNDLRNPKISSKQSVVVPPYY